MTPDDHDTDTKAGRTADDSGPEPAVGTVANPGRTDETPGSPSTQHDDTELLGGLPAVVLVAALFAVALLVGRGVFLTAETLSGLDRSGTMGPLLVGVLGLQVLGFGSVTVVYLALRRQSPTAYLRLDAVTKWTVTAGVFVGMVLMVLTAATSVLYGLLDLHRPATTATIGPPGPEYYLVLFVVSTLVAVPLEEIFFRGLLQRRLEESLHPAVAVTLASLWFVPVHTSLSLQTGGEALFVALYFAFGLVLGVAYHLTENLFVPIVGHAMFNAVQILVRLAELLV